MRFSYERLSVFCSWKACPTASIGDLDCQNDQACSDLGWFGRGIPRSYQKNLCKPHVWIFPMF